MKAAVYYGAGDIRVEERPVPEPGPDEVLLRVKACGICGSDVEAYQVGIYEPGVVIGHELAAEVVEVGEEVEGWLPGDRATVNGVIPCLTCAYCRAGRPSLCENVVMTGLTMDGGMAEFMKAPARALHRLPEGMSDIEGALVDPLAMALHGVNLSRLRPGDRVLVLGGGPIGLLTTMAAFLAGAAEVYVSEVNPYRAELARQLGATRVIDPSRENLAYLMDSLTRGQGCDVAFLCAGSAESMAEPFTLVKKGGQMVVLGICHDPVPADFLTLVMSELEIRGSYASYDEYDRAIALLAAGRIRPLPLVTATIPLEQVVEEGFAVLARRDARAMKIIVQPQAARLSPGAAPGEAQASGAGGPGNSARWEEGRGRV